jgi:hypothetical protein
VLEPHLEPVTLKVRQRLEPADHKIASVYFIDAGLASVIAFGASGRRQAEVAVIGREDMTGAAIVLGVGRSPPRNRCENRRTWSMHQCMPMTLRSWKTSIRSRLVVASCIYDGGHNRKGWVTSLR